MQIIHAIALHAYYSQSVQVDTCAATTACLSIVFKHSSPEILTDFVEDIAVNLLIKFSRSHIVCPMNCSTWLVSIPHNQSIGAFSRNQCLSERFSNIGFLYVTHNSN